MLSVSYKSDSVNERTKEISELMKLHIQGVWQNDHILIRQMAHYTTALTGYYSNLSYITDI